MSSDLQQFIERQNAKKISNTSVDWDKRRAKWLDALNDVFDQISTWLQDAGLAPESIVRGSRELREETLGRYEAPTLSLRLPDGIMIDFTPVASVIIGGYGRIDATAQRGMKKLYLIAVDLDEQNHAQGTPSYERNWAWRIFEPGNPRTSTELNPEGLAELLAGLSG